MKWIFKLLTAPIVLTIDLFTLVCVGIISCSAVLFRIASSIIALLGVMVLATYCLCLRYGFSAHFKASLISSNPSDSCSGVVTAPGLFL